MGMKADQWRCPTSALGNERIDRIGPVQPRKSVHFESLHDQRYGGCEDVCGAQLARRFQMVEFKLYKSKATQRTAPKRDTSPLYAKISIFGVS
ncbi:hypothetical protein PHSY_004937 [Pseudozyma hubeiensis SY62]|uniref:Uncharacterized protein n=1 Tax=Pseudozyma hubeiensis (strain SY62) TaxID=1305764 RepID=R9P7Z8_PSEHS|nr:hypothetical protein PHSY_004937 [Pseudozyma hubeiensis SY62]GAC97352.1 hypothetical protein PHSY_004937 [Pseudozyma hubeiensis SY62]